MDMLLTVSLYIFTFKPKQPVGHYFLLDIVHLTNTINKRDAVLHTLSDYTQSPILDFAPFSYVTLY